MEHQKLWIRLRRITVLRWRRLLAALAEGPTAGPCPASPTRGGVGQYQSSSLESSSLTTGAPLAGCTAVRRHAATRSSSRRCCSASSLSQSCLDQGERRVHRHDVVGGDEVFEGPRDRLALTRLIVWKLHVRRRQAFTVRRRRCDEDDDRPFSPTSQGHQARGNFPRRFLRICFLRTPRARPGGRDSLGSPDG
jgi:hypothetical protein